MIRYYKDKSVWQKSNKKDRKTPGGKKVHRIATWKYTGIISNDWNKTYDYYINCLNCEWCDKPLKDSSYRHLDHDHNINDDVNFEGDHLIKQDVGYTFVPAPGTHWKWFDGFPISVNIEKEAGDKEESSGQEADFRRHLPQRVVTPSFNTITELKSIKTMESKINYLC